VSAKVMERIARRERNKKATTAPKVQSGCFFYGAKRLAQIILLMN
jgi:hypothetical protein